MIPPEQPPAARGSVFGDNSGSMVDMARAEQREALFEIAREGGKTFAERRDEFIASAQAQNVKDRASAGDAADTIKLAGEVWQMIDADRRARSDPYREAHLALSGIASEFWQPVVDAMADLAAQIDAYTADIDHRIAEQQREQEAHMAARRAPAAVEPPAAAPLTATAGRPHMDYSGPAPAPRTTAPAMRAPRRAKIRGDLGSTISARDEQIYEIEDIRLIPDHIMQSPVVRDAILAVVRKTAKMMGVPAGIRVSTATVNQIS